jgi:hypothetical protein
MSTILTCSQVYQKTPTEVLGVQVDFRGLLREGELLTGTPAATGTGITTSSVAVNTTVDVINGQRVDIGKAINFTVSAGTAGNDYAILVSCTTSASQTRECYVTIQVRTS